MNDRTERITAALTAAKVKIQADKDSISALQSENTRLNELYEKFKALSEMTYWAELDSGTSIAVDDVVRYFGHNYKCIQAHTKALTRYPKNTDYWEEVEDDS